MPQRMKADGTPTEPRVAGRCAEHDDLAWLYEDGSIDCHYCAVVETSSPDCLWQPLPFLWVVPHLSSAMRAAAEGGDG